MPDLADGEAIEVKGSAAKPYVLRNVGGVYSCSCPAWRNQSVPIERRTCKHLRKLRGDAAELERIGGALSTGPTATGPTATGPAARGAPRSGAEAKQGPPLLLAQPWDQTTDLTEWWMSEKLDGVRAFWDGRRFLSRQGNEFHAPPWFIAGLPEVPLDGELWIDRKKFQRTVSIVRRQDQSDLWREVRYLVFDAPQCDGQFEERLEVLNDCLRPERQPYAVLHQHHRCEGLEHLRDELARIESLDGEGLMLREPGSRYEVGRSSTLLKVKRFRDAEAVVLEHQAGKGKHKGRLGALVAQLPDGTVFSIGTGFSDAERASPPPVGSLVTFRYQELSDAGVPRFPSFVRLRQAAAPAAPPAEETLRPSSGRPARRSPPDGEQAAQVAPAAADGGAQRYFECVQGTSSKFWEISLFGQQVAVRYGRIGSQGTARSTEFSDASSAATHAQKLIDQKTSKGYVERPRGE